MNTRQIRILAINPGSRYLGIAVFDGAELYDWAVKVVGGENLAGKKSRVRKLISEQICRYGVNTLALKEVHPARSSYLLLEIVSEVKTLARSQRLAVRMFSIQETKRQLLSSGTGNKRLLLQEIAQRHPFLLPDIRCEEESKSPYLMRMFEAVAMGIVCFNKLDSGNAKVAKTNK
jgi:Holliday junction resolvasome RuvABC endonuclease subunit